MTDDGGAVGGNHARQTTDYDRRATAFVPAHVTAFFAPQRADDAATTGATGAGLALSDGIETSVEPAADRDSTDHDDSAHHVTLDGDPAEIDPVFGVLDTLDVPPVSVAVESAVPIGAGFGVSGGAALGTALAVNDLFGLARSENDIVAVAHAAEVSAGTGLGDIVGAARGGLPLRLDPGDPEHGRFDGIPATPRIEYVSFGEFSTADVLSGDTEPVTEAGERALERVVETPTVSELLAAAREFATESRLLGGDTREAIEAVEAAGGHASMAMLGRTVFAAGTGLSDAGYDPAVCAVDSGGARVLDGSARDD
jgi:pantoate kinase